MPETDQTEVPRRAGVNDRDQKRFRCYDRMILRFAIKPSFKNCFALVHDASTNGIGFIIDEPIEAGATLILQLRGRVQGTSLVRTAKVMHVRKHLPVPDAPWVKRKPLLKSLLSFFTGNGTKDLPFVYLVGCRFTPPMAIEELEDLFGRQP